MKYCTLRSSTVLLLYPQQAPIAFIRQQLVQRTSKIAKDSINNYSLFYKNFCKETINQYRLRWRLMTFISLSRIRLHHMVHKVDMQELRQPFLPVVRWMVMMEEWGVGLELL